MVDRAIAYLRSHHELMTEAEVMYDELDALLGRAPPIHEALAECTRELMERAFTLRGDLGNLPERELRRLLDAWVTELRVYEVHSEMAGSRA